MMLSIFLCAYLPSFFFGVVAVQIFVHLKNQIVFLLVGLESSLYILDTSQSFVDMWFANTSSQSAACLFVLSTGRLQ